MIEIIFLFIGTGAIASFARGRGAKPAVWGSVAVVGFVVMAFLVGPLTMRALGWKESFLPTFMAAGWFGLVALYVRFGIGAGKPHPDSQWFCPECKFMNGRHAIICEACGSPWKPA